MTWPLMGRKGTNVWGFELTSAEMATINQLNVKKQMKTDDVTAVDNPLRDLPALPKVHWSWPRCLPGHHCGHTPGTPLLSEAILQDYVRITHSFPLSINARGAGGFPASSEEEVELAVRLCHRVGNASIAVNFSPWYVNAAGRF